MLLGIESRGSVGLTVPEAEEIANLLLARLVRDTLDVDCGRHDDAFLVSFDRMELFSSLDLLASVVAA